jgi:hypothetical protein
MRTRFAAHNEYTLERTETLAQRTDLREASVAAWCVIVQRRCIVCVHVLRFPGYIKLDYTQGRAVLDIRHTSFVVIAQSYTM